VSCVPLTNVVVRGAPFHCTTELETKLVPVTVNVKAAPPAVALLGESDESVGTGVEGDTFTVTLDDWEPPDPVQLNVNVVLLVKGTLTSDPLGTDLSPDQGPPAAVQDVAFVVVHDSVVVVLALTGFGLAVRFTTGGGVPPLGMNMTSTQ